MDDKVQGMVLVERKLQKAVVIYFLTEKKNNLDELNELYNTGWKVINQSAMGGGGGNNAVEITTNYGGLKNKEPS